MRLGWWGPGGLSVGGASPWASLAVGQRVLGRALGWGPGAAGGSCPQWGCLLGAQAWTPPVSRWRPLLEMPNMVPRPGVGNVSLVSDRAR